MCPNPCLPARRKLVFLLPALLFLLLVNYSVALTATTSECSFQLVYKGRDKAILAYSFVGSDANGSERPVTLRAVSDSGQTLDIAGPVTTGGGTKQIAGLNPITWTVSLSDGTACTGGELGNGVFYINGSVQGTPLYGDTISGGQVGDIDVDTTLQSGAFRLDGVTVLGSMGLYNSGGADKLVVENSIVTGLINVYSSNITLRGNQLLGSVHLGQRSNILIQDNVLTEPIYLGSIYDWDKESWVCGDWCEPGAEPMITGNSFVGQYALRAPDAYHWWEKPISRPIPVGCNFYGSPFGYTAAVDNTGGPYYGLPFLAYGGAYVDTKQFYAECKSTDGKYTSDAVFPKIWAESWIAGQNVLVHANGNYVPYGWVLTGRNTLLSVDVRSTRETLKGVKFYVMWNGQRVDSLPTNVRRWYSSYLDDDGFKKTVNFVLPPVPVSEEEIVDVTDCGVYADISGLSGIGRPAGNDIPLTGCSMQFRQPPKSKLKVYVVPVHVYGSCSGNASVSNITATLADYFAAMFPIRPQDISVTVGPPITFECSYLASKNATWFWSAANRYVATASAVTAKQPLYDRVVAVIPTKPGFGIEGSNSPYNRNLLLVREDVPEALVHEMGHSLRLPDNYTGWPSNNDGELLRGLTAFNPEMDASFGVAPGKHFWASEPLPYTYDIMGSANPIWPSNLSFQTFQGYFATFVAAAEAAATPIEVKAIAGRTVFLSGDMEAVGPGLQSGYFTKMDKASVSLVDLTGLGLNPGSMPEASFDDRYTTYRVEGYDAGGQMVFEQRFMPLTYYPQFYSTLDIPADVTALHFIGNDAPEHIVWERDDTFAATLLTPQAGAALTDTLTFTWQQSRDDLLHLVLYSTNGGATWDAISPPFRGDRLEISTEFLPVSDQISLRVITADAFRNTETRVDGLVMTNRPPTVLMRFPPDGAQADPGFAWTLDAISGDLDDQTTGVQNSANVAGQWSSSLDGVLGTGDALYDVVLSPGTHVLTFAVQDSAGLTTQRQLTVKVAPVTTVDLALTDDSFALLAAGYDPWIQGSTTFLSPGVTNTVSVEMMGAGVPVTATVALYVTPPEGTQELLTRTTLPLGVFERGSVSAPYTPESGGTYLFQAVIEEATLPDPNTANNEHAWSAIVHLTLYLPTVGRERTWP